MVGNLYSKFLTGYNRSYNFILMTTDLINVKRFTIDIFLFNISSNIDEYSVQKRYFSSYYFASEFIAFFNLCMHFWQYDVYNVHKYLQCFTIIRKSSHLVILSLRQFYVLANSMPIIRIKKHHSIYLSLKSRSRSRSVCEMEIIIGSKKVSQKHLWK